MAEEYAPVLAPEFSHLKIDVADPRFIAAREFAKANNFTAAQWQQMLSIEARGVMAKAAAPPAPKAPAPKAPEPIPGYAKMSFAEKLAIGEARKNGGR